jgi:hypothetical protein
MQPNDRTGDPGRRPYPVKADRDRQLRQRQRRPEAPACFLPKPPDYRPALPGGQPWKQIDRDPSFAAHGLAVQPGSIVRSSRKIDIANANHNTIPFTHAKPRTHAAPAVHAISRTEYNAADCHVHGK